MTIKEREELDSKLSQQRSNEVTASAPDGMQQWSAYPQEGLMAPGSKTIPGAPGVS